MPKPPKLYNPKLVCAAALLFTPLFGAALQARNWLELGRPHNAAASRMWIRASVWLLAVFIVMQTIFRHEPVMDWLGPYFLVVIWGAWMLTGGWQQLAEVSRTVGKNYEPLPMGRPIFLGLAGWLAYGLVSVTIALGLALAGFEELPGASANAPATSEDAGVVIRIPEGSDKPVVEKLPARPAQSESGK